MKPLYMQSNNELYGVVSAPKIAATKLLAPKWSFVFKREGLGVHPRQVPFSSSLPLYCTAFMARIDIRSLQLIVNILYYICLICVTFTLVKQTSHPLAVLRFYGFYLEFVFCFEPSKEEKSEEGSSISHTIYFFCFDHICLVTVLTVLLVFFQVMFANIKNVELYFSVLLGLDVYGWATNFFLLLIHTYLNSFSVIFFFWKEIQVI